MNNVGLRVAPTKLMRGFTLIELMIVVVIIGILASIAYPSYISHVQKTRQADAQGEMMTLANAMEMHKAKNFSYKNASIASLAPKLSSSTFYTYTLNLGADNQTYTITATPKGMMAGTGALKWSSSGGGDWE